MMNSLGSDPDPRFSLANERTALAWVQTSLAFLAGAVALATVEVPVPALVRGATAIVLLLTAVAAALYAWTGWQRTEVALRNGQSLPRPRALLLLVVACMIGATLLITVGLTL